MIGNMFNFFMDAYNYEDRKVARFDGNNFTIDTCAVSDSDEPYETGIKHPLYNDNKWVIVEMYNTHKDAQSGHNKWVKIMTQKELPTQLNDVSTCGLRKMANLLEETP